MPTDLTRRYEALVEELGLARADAVRDVTALTGGVASDIAVLTVGDRRLCAKFALPKLRVAQDWQAPVHRNAAEYAWLAFAAEVDPRHALRLYGRSQSLSGFAMEFVAGPDVLLWKTALLAGEQPEGAARSVGDAVGRIHAASARPGFDATAFQNREDFYALRIEPYLTFTAGQHAAVAGTLNALAAMLHGSDTVLVHGDVSPKNILFRARAPLILDAECATMGDACFDPAFCLNHLVLKAVHLPASRRFLLREIAAFWSAYADHIHWEDGAALEARICRLLPALMLARIDGKSPVEYLAENERDRIRALAIAELGAPKATLGAFVAGIAGALGAQ